MKLCAHKTETLMELARRSRRPSVHYLVFVTWLAVATYASASDLAVLRNGFSIRHERREVVGSVTRLYLGANKDGYVDVPTDEIDHFEPDLSLQPAAPSPQGLHGVVSAASDRYHLDPDLVNSVIHAESGFDAKAISPKGAQGLMQLMPQTASKLGVSDAFDPAANVDGGARYLRALLEQYNFDLIKALAAYNAGPQRVEKYHGVPPYYETQAYIARIVRDFNRKKLAERKAEAANKSTNHKSTKASADGSVRRTALESASQQASR
jgi:soluble lytic murein transglycosylase-like protein